MDSNASAVVHTEDVVQALIDNLVDPILPLKASNHDPPPLSLRESVANQMHAVVLLYNYYHRKQYPRLEFLDFESFCKLAVISKIGLLVHMKYMQKSSCESDGLDNMLSITEKAIMGACNICKGLDEALNDPRMEVGWPISKVAVFLIDPMKENCVLLFSVTTQGVWSLIEKSCDRSHILEFGAEKSTRKKKSANDVYLQKLAFSAVKETTGNDLSDLMVLESHIVYSLSEEKSAARFYIMQCNKSFKEDVIQVPIEDAFNSLRGPLVVKNCNDCTVTPVVEYFQLLPYARIVEDWLFRRQHLEMYSLQKQLLLLNTCRRKMSPNGLQQLREEKGNGNMEFPRTSEPSIAPAKEKNDRSNPGKCPTFKTSNAIIGSLKKKGANKFCVDNLPDASCGQHNVDEGKSSPLHQLSEGKNTSIIYQASNTSIECDSSSRRSNVIDKVQTIDFAEDPSNTKQTGVKAASVHDSYIIGSSGQDDIPAADYDLIPVKSSSQKLDKGQVVMDSKRNELFQASLRVLVKKRNELTHQQRLLDDEIARCEKNLLTVLNGGEVDENWSTDATVSHREAVLQFQERSPVCLKRKRLSEAILHLRNPCQELDDICCENNWILPRYTVFPSDEGFHANVLVQGVDFGCSGAGDLRPDPRTARESAAAHVLNKLRRMASHAQGSPLSKN